MNGRRVAIVVEINTVVAVSDGETSETVVGARESEVKSPALGVGEPKFEVVDEDKPPCTTIECPSRNAFIHCVLLHRRHPVFVIPKGPVDVNRWHVG